MTYQKDKEQPILPVNEKDTPDAHMRKSLKNNRILINVLSHIVEFRNGESGLHTQNMQEAVKILLKRLLQKTDRYDFSEEDIEVIAMASSLHDIGKIKIDEKILNKPESLTPAEYNIMKNHSMIGALMLRELRDYQDDPMIKAAYEICRWHHEQYDGNGYPDGLKGDEIPITAQVVSLADAYDALTKERCYRKAFSHEEAMRMIQNGECGCFNPLLLECLVEEEEKFYQLSQLAFEISK